MRLIDADALKEVFNNLASDDYNEPIWYQKTVFEEIDKAPTITIPVAELDTTNDFDDIPIGGFHDD